jgi:hypothetical protein
MNLSRRVVVTCVVLTALTLPLFAAAQAEASGAEADLSAPDTGNPAWDEAFLEEYQELLAESGIPPEVAALVLSEIPRKSSASDPEDAATIAMRETARVDASVRRGSLPNRAAVEARSRLQTALRDASRDGEGAGEGPPQNPGAAIAPRSNRALQALERNRGPRGRGPVGPGPPSGRRRGPPALPDGVQDGGGGRPDGNPSGTPDTPANTPNDPGPFAVDRR